MRDTRRAREEWLRDVGRDLRAGVVSRALDVLRERGAVREHVTHDEARVALVRSCAEAMRAGKSVLLVATRNDAVKAMNELAREAIAETLGEERIYATDFGERAFAIGEALVGPERALGVSTVLSLAGPHRRRRLCPRVVGRGAPGTLRRM